MTHKLKRVLNAAARVVIHGLLCDVYQHQVQTQNDHTSKCRCL